MTTVKKQRIMQRSKLVDDLFFLVPPSYNSHDMSDFTFLIEYLKPVSKEYETEILDLCEERYEDYLKYKLPIDTNLTKEAGKIEIQPSFIYADLDADGNPIQQVRKVSSTTIEVIPISRWSDIIPDNALSAIDQRIIMVNAQMKAMNEAMDALDDNKADNIKYDKESHEFQLTSGGKVIGNKVTIECSGGTGGITEEELEEGIPVVDFNSALPEEPETPGDEDDEDVVIQF